MPMRRSFTVEGYTPFPLDMLRYDQCWPYSLEDAVLIAETIAGRAGKTRIKLTGCHDPSLEMWRSWDWRVLLLQ
jgi:hypothetical protein